MKVHICANPKFCEKIKNIVSQTIDSVEINKNSDHCDLILFHKDKCVKKLPSSRIILYNSDMEVSTNYFGDEKLYLITYGLNAKSTITASSIEGKNMLICIQRSFQNINGKTLLPQEIPVSYNVKITDVSDKIAEASLLIMLGIDLKNISSYEKSKLRKK